MRACNLTDLRTKTTKAATVRGGKSSFDAFLRGDNGCVVGGDRGEFKNGRVVGGDRGEF